MNQAFAGDDYVPERDDVRLTAQIERIRAFMSDGQFHTLRVIAAGTGAPEASILAQLRHLTKPQHGSHRRGRRHLGHGLYTYQILPPNNEPTELKPARRSRLREALNLVEAERDEARDRIDKALALMDAEPGCTRTQVRAILESSE